MQKYPFIPGMAQRPTHPTRRRVGWDIKKRIFFARKKNTLKNPTKIQGEGVEVVEVNQEGVMGVIIGEETEETEETD